MTEQRAEGGYVNLPGKLFFLLPRQCRDSDFLIFTVFMSTLKATEGPLVCFASSYSVSELLPSSSLASGFVARGIPLKPGRFCSCAHYHAGALIKNSDAFHAHTNKPSCCLCQTNCRNK